MDVNKQYSPLYKIRKPLFFLRWTLGFPLQTIDNSYLHFRFATWVECVRFSLLFSTYITQFVFWGILILVKDGNLSNYVDSVQQMYENFSRSKMDQILAMIFLLIVIIKSIVYLVIFKYNTKSINKCCNDITRMKSKILCIQIKHIEERKPNVCRVEKSTQTIIYGQIFCLVSAILHSVWCLFHLQSSVDEKTFLSYGISVQVIWPMLVTIQYVCTLFGPISCAAEIVVCQLIYSLTDLFDDWKDILRCGSQKLQINNETKCQDEIQKSPTIDLEHDEMLERHYLQEEENDVHCSSTTQSEDVIDIGLNIERLIIVINNATQGLIMTFFISSIACLIICCFITVAYFGLNDSSREIWQYAYGVANISVALMFLLRIYSLMDSGQQLAVQIKQSRRGLEDLMINQDAPGSLNESSSNKLCVLRKRLEVYQYLNPISPYAVFGLSNRAFCGTLASIVTYIIVLIKLRGIETSQSSSGLDTVNGTALT